MPRRSIATSTFRALAVWLSAALVAPWATFAQDAPPDDVTEKSLPLRTALHHDPSLKAPLEQLLGLYRGAGQVDQLVALYETHVKQYPNDENGLIVLIRLKAATGDPEALRSARTAAERFSTNAYLQYLLHDILRQRHDPAALTYLDKAVELETRPSRKLLWIDELLAAATLSDRRDLAQKHLTELAKSVATPDEHLELARKMIRFEFYEMALGQLDKGAAGASPETMVAIQLEAANAEVGLDHMAKAAARLDQLLAKLTADYWQRGEIIRRRLALIRSQSEREAIIAAARKQVEKDPRDEAAALDLAQVLAALQHRREALDVLLAASRRMPKSEQIEKRTLEMFDRLRDDHGRAAYLVERIKMQPKRHDLAVQRIKTLYQLGHHDEGKQALDALVDQVSEADRMNFMLDMARFLRRASLQSAAAELFRRLVEIAPGRLDIRRELAETYLALGQRGRIGSLLDAKLPPEASLENLMDFVQFMIQQELLVEARRAVEQRLAQESRNLELQLLLLSIHRRLGNARAGETLIEDCRQLADTAARYRLWLEAAVQWHDEFETVDSFLEAELLRLENDPVEWSTRRLLRRLAFAEVAADNGQLETALILLQNDLDGDPPQEFRVKIRQQLIALLEKEPNRIAEVQEQLKLLGEEDRRFVDESTARLALLYVRAQRHDLAQPLLEKINLGNIQDPTLLAALENLYRQHSRQQDVLVILGRLTQLNPTDRQNWERWLTVLAGTGDELRLRGALRQLLSGVPKMPVSEDTKRLLEKHLADSYGRSIARKMARGTDAATADALSLLGAAERMAQDDQQWLWVAWIRAFALNRLGRISARDEAIQEMQRMIARVYAPLDAKKPGQRRIAMPDGLTVDATLAVKLLTEPAAVRAMSMPREAVGPLPELKISWSFDTDLAVSSILPLKDGRVLITDFGGAMYCVDGSNGKLLWQKSDVVPPIPIAHMQHHGHSNAVATAGAKRVVSDGNGRLLVPAVSSVSCYSDADGKLLWTAEVGATGGEVSAAGSAPVSVLLYRGMVVTYEPRSGTLTKIDPQTGKIRWDMTLKNQKPLAIAWQNSGTSLSGNRLLVYGARSAILDLDGEHVLWSFEPWRVRRYPVKLPDPAEEAEKDKQPAAAAAASASLTSHATYVPGSTGGHPLNPQLQMWQQMQAQQQLHQVGGPQFRFPQACQSVYGRGMVAALPQTAPLVNYLAAAAPNVVASSATPQFNMGLSSPAVVWASLVGNGAPGQARLIDDRLLLIQHSKLRVMSTQLPLAGREVSVSGSILGAAGASAVFVDVAQRKLQFVHLDSGTVYAYQPQQDAKPSQNAPVQAVLDGPLAYFSGPWGIDCVNVLTRQRVFHSPWPEDAVPRPVPPLDGSAVNLAVPTAAASASQLRTAVLATMQPGAQPQIHTVTPAACALAPNKLYTLVTSTRVVALAGNPANGN